MKKIDLHIHTVPTISDSKFTFCMDAFKAYVETVELDAVAITNHDVFDLPQFVEITRNLSIRVFPGIEINVGKAHILVISEQDDLDDFEERSRQVSVKIQRVGDSISVDELIEIYGDLNKYLVIPHYEKSPSISGDCLNKIRQYVSAGEVDSAKKFVRNIKDDSKLTPVLFSDLRIKTGLNKFPMRQTFVDCGELTVRALKTCLLDKSKVCLSRSDGNQLWQVFQSGQKISTGLNVIIGARSSGKSHTLDQINNAVESAKYIKQFSLVQQDEAVYEKEFRSDIERRRSTFVDEYLAGFKRVIDEMIKVDLVANEKRVERYMETLLKSAEEVDRSDAFSKSVLFHEVEFPIGNTNTLTSLIESVRQVIENIEFRNIIEKHLELSALKKLALELIEVLWARELEHDKKRIVNELIKEVKQGLKIRTSATQVEDIDFYQLKMDDRRVQKFSEIVEALKNESVIFEETIQGFRIEAKRMAYTGAGEIKAVSGVKTAFSDVYRSYHSPYQYLRGLLSNENLPRSEFYKLFVNVRYRILNEDGFEVSGGERSEFRLLQEIADAQNYDILLIDEPESSFDNLFLKSDVNKILKGISETMPVVVVTHNSTVGASVGADFVLHTRKEIEGGRPVYRVYSGYPTDKNLYSIDGKSISSHDVMMDSLEAGFGTYEGRRKAYEAIKN